MLSDSLIVPLYSNCSDSITITSTLNRTIHLLSVKLSGSSRYVRSKCTIITLLVCTYSKGGNSNIYDLRRINDECDRSKCGNKSQLNKYSHVCYHYRVSLQWKWFIIIYFPVLIKYRHKIGIPFSDGK